MENGSLTILTCVATMNLLKSSYFQSGNSPAGSADTLFLYYDWIEAAFLGLIPVIVGGIAAIAIVVRVFGFVWDQL